MCELKDVIRHRFLIILAPGLQELGEVNGCKPETEHINTIYPVITITGSAQFALIAFGILFVAIHITRHARDRSST